MNRDLAHSFLLLALLTRPGLSQDPGTPVAPPAQAPQEPQATQVPQAPADPKATPAQDPKPAPAQEPEQQPTHATAQEPKDDSPWKFERGQGLRYETDGFGLLWRGHVTTRWSMTEVGGSGSIGSATNENGLDLVQTRTSFSGHAFQPDLFYRIEIDGTDQDSEGSILKEAWGEYGGLRVGQGKTLFGLEATGSDTGQFFTDRSIAGRAFSGARSRGAWLVGGSDEARSTIAVGVINGDVAGGISEGSPTIPGFDGLGEEAANTDREPGYVATFGLCASRNLRGKASTIESWQQTSDPLEGANGNTPATPVWFGVSWARGNGTQAGTKTTGDRDGLDIESDSLSFQFLANGMRRQTKTTAMLMAEWFLRRDALRGANGDEEHSQGFSAALAFADEGGGFGIRFSKVFTDEGLAGTGVNFLSGVPGIGAIDGDVTELTGVVSLFNQGHAWKTQFEYTWQAVDPQDGPHQNNHLFTIQMQIGF